MSKACLLWLKDYKELKSERCLYFGFHLSDSEIKISKFGEC